ncbi:MAG: hypothetical protein WCT04_12885 [Planctomycetota bacterium]
MALLLAVAARAENVQSEIETLRKEMADMRERLISEKEAAKAETQNVRKDMAKLQSQVNDLKMAESPIVSDVEKLLPVGNVFDKPVNTGAGRVKIGGLVQAWYYALERDTKGLLNSRPAGFVDHGIAGSQNTFQTRRAELNFTIDINQYVTAFMKTDFAADADPSRSTYVSLSGSNQGFIKAALNNRIRNNDGTIPAVLQDALINFHSFVPHHDLTIGQMLPYFGEEEFLPSSGTDFVERSWIGSVAPRDIGVVLHGAWWDDYQGVAYQGAGNTGRVQYWLGAFNSTSYYHDGTTQLAADNNASKDFLGRLMVRPLWDYTYGRLELSAAYGFGKHGNTPLNQAIHELNAAAAFPYLNGAPPSWGQRFNAFVGYQPQRFAKGLWFKYEYAWLRDTTATIPNTTGVFSTTGAAAPDHYQPFSSSGYYVSAGYNLGKVNSLYCLPDWIKHLEFDARYQRYENIWNQSSGKGGTRINTFATQQATFGINYYIRGNYAKIQANYDIVRDPKGTSDYRFHSVRNDSFSMNFQVMW